MQKFIFLTLLSFLALSCEEQITNKYNEYKVQGIDRHGNSRICFNDPDKTVACPSIAIVEEEEFAQKCKESGNKVHPCGCHEYICEQETFKGIDINGEIRSCKLISPSEVCTMDFQEGDQFARECEADDGKAIQCGCHDFICQYPEHREDSEDPAQEPDEMETFYGTNQDGVERSCPAQKNLNCPTVISHVNVYAQNCKEEGHDAIWCSCREVLCLDQ